MSSVGAIEHADLAVSTLAHAQYFRVDESSHKCRDLRRRHRAMFLRCSGLANHRRSCPWYLLINVEVTSFPLAFILRRWLWPGWTLIPWSRMCSLPRLPAKHVSFSGCTLKEDCGINSFHTFAPLDVTTVKTDRHFVRDPPLIDIRKQGMRYGKFKIVSPFR